MVQGAGDQGVFDPSVELEQIEQALQQLLGQEQQLAAACSLNQHPTDQPSRDTCRGSQTTHAVIHEELYIPATGPTRGTIEPEVDLQQGEAPASDNWLAKASMVAASVDVGVDNTEMRLASAAETAQHNKPALVSQLQSMSRPTNEQQPQQLQQPALQQASHLQPTAAAKLQQLLQRTINELAQRQNKLGQHSADRTQPTANQQTTPNDAVVPTTTHLCTGLQSPLQLDSINASAPNILGCQRYGNGSLIGSTLHDSNTGRNASINNILDSTQPPKRAKVPVNSAGSNRSPSPCIKAGKPIRAASTTRKHASALAYTGSSSKAADIKAGLAASKRSGATGDVLMRQLLQHQVSMLQVIDDMSRNEDQCASQLRAYKSQVITPVQSLRSLVWGVGSCHCIIRHALTAIRHKSLHMLCR